MNTQLKRARWQTVIVGSGHNALVAAAYLARAGRSVAVLEKNDYLGGATTSQRIFPDYDANLSRYAYLVSLFPQSIIDDLELDFQTRRRKVASFTPWREPNGSERGLLLWNDNESASRQSVFELTGDESAWHGYQHLLQLESALAEIAWPSLLQPLRHRRDFFDNLKTPNQREAWEAFVERPLGEIIERLIPNDVLRGLLMTDGKIGVFTHPHDPTLLQNRCFLYHVIGGGTGEWRVPIGGMQALVKALVKDCRQHGVQFLTNASALRVVPGSTEQEVFFEYEGEQHSWGARDVLINASPRTYATLLGQAWQPAPADEGSVIKMNMLLKRLPRLKSGVPAEQAFCGSLHLDEGYQWMQETYSTASRGTIPNPPPCEVYCHSLTDPSILSPELQAAGYHTLTLFGLDMPYRLFQQDHATKKRQLVKLYLDALNRICDEPFAECLELDLSGKPCIELKTPQDLEAEVGLDLGNIFHNQLSWFFTDEEAEVGKWGVETNHPHIFLAGSGATRGGAVSGVAGYNAAQCVLWPE